MSYEYKDLKIDGKIKISPSGFGNFYSNPNYWYKQNILKENIFTGNTLTVAGSIIHRRCELYWLGLEPIDDKEELAYLDRYKDNVSVNDWEVIDRVTNLWKAMEVTLKDYPKPDKMEQSIVFEIPDSKYYLAGSYDALRGNTVIDIKTTSQSQKKIKVGHRLQLLIYALILRLNGEPIDSIEVIYVVNTKTPKVIVINEPIEDRDIDYIKGEIKSMLKRLDLVEANKDLLDVIFFDNKDSYL